MEFLLGGLCFLVAVTVIGHGLWVLLSKLFSDPAAERFAAAPRRCPRCSLPLVRGDCEVCRWPRVVGLQPPDSERALDTLEAQIAQLGRLHALDSALCQQLTAQIATERTRLAEARTGHAAGDIIVMAMPVDEPPAREPPPLRSPWVENTPQEPLPSASGHPAEPRSAAYVQPPRPAAAPFPASPAQNPPPQVAGGSWTDWLAGFMEEKNIRWGELVGGLLIVCSSIALVISFWSAIESRPWLKFLLFNGVTAAIFGVGFYSEYRWRLNTTSRGLLTIGGLLVPLNFLAIAAFSSAPGTQGLATIVGEGLSAALFAVLVYFAGQVLVRRDEAWLTAGLLVPALSQLLVRRLIDPSAAISTVALVVAVPAVCYLVVNLWHQRRAASELVLSERQVHELFRFLGLTSFAVVLPLALLLYKTGHPILTLRQLPALAGLLGFVPLSAGLLVWHQLAGRSLAALRTAGTAIGVFGAAVTLAGLVIGWPEPNSLVPAALLEFAIFTFIAWRFGIPAAHLVAAACLAVAYLLLAHLTAGEIAWSGNDPAHLAATLISGESGMLLAPLVLFYAGLAFVARRRAYDGSWALAAAFAGCMAISVALLAWFGWGNRGVPLAAGWIYLLYAACWLAIATRQSRAAPAWIGLALLLAGVVQEVVFHYGESLGLLRPLVAASLIFSSAAVAIALAAGSKLLAKESALAFVAWRAALAVSLVAAAYLIGTMPTTPALWQATHWTWVAAIWGSIVLVAGWLPVGTLFQGSLVLTAGFVAVAVIERRAWFIESPHPWLDPWTWQTLGVAVVALNIAWALLRLAVGHSDDEKMAVATASSRLRDRLSSPWLNVDRVTTGLLIALLVGLGVVAALPGAIAEISPAAAAPSQLAQQWQDEGLLHTHAGNVGSWVFLIGLLILLGTMLRARASHGWMYAGLLIAAMSCPLLASRLENQHAVASGLAWCSTAFVLAASALVWSRTALVRQVARLGWPTFAGDPRAAREATSLVLLLGLFAPVLLASTIAGQAVLRGAGDDAWPPEPSMPAAVVTMVLLVLAAAILWSLAERFLQTDLAAARPNWPLASYALLLALGVIPVVALIVNSVAVEIAQHPIRGPDPTSLFGQIGWPLNGSGPLLLAALALVGYAVRERSGRFALAGGLMCLLAVSVAHLSASAAIIDEIAVRIRWAQLSAAVAALYTLGWVALAAWDRRREGRYGLSVGGDSYDAQSSLAPAITALLMLWGWCEVVWHPVAHPAAVLPPQFADAWGASSFALVALSVWLAAVACDRRLSHLATSALLVALATFAAGVAARWDQGNWLAYNTLYVGHMLIAAGLTAAAWQRLRRLLVAADTTARAPAGALWPSLQASIVVLLALRELDANGTPALWWSVAGLTLVGLVLAPALAWIFERRRYLYLAVPLVNFAGVIAAHELGWIPEFGDAEFVYWDILLLALPGPLWLAIERWGISRRHFSPAVMVPPVHRLVATLSVSLLVYAVAVALWGDATEAFGKPQLLAVNWLALAATSLLLFACLWDEARESIALLCVLGLAACGMVLDGFNLEPKWLLWTGAMVLGAYALATSYLWSQRSRLQSVAQALGMPHSNGAEATHDLAGLAWLVPANTFLVAVVVFMTFTIEMIIERTDLRVLASLATLAQVASLALLAVGDRRGTLQYAALVVGAAGAVFFGWAWLDIDSSFTLLHAMIVVAAATAAVAALYGFGLAKCLPDGSEWLAAAQRITPWLATLSLGSLVATLALEVFEFAETGAVRIGWPAVLTVAITLAGLALAALAAAVLPGRDPLNLSERGRTAYVYAAEIILTLLFVHIRVTLPWLFSGFFQQYWPLIVMGIAFLGVGFAELLRRREQHVLATPLENTGVLLPVLPVLGYWTTTSSVDYSLLLLAVGMLYAGLSIARRSFGFGVLAALAANGGLWFLLGRQEGWGFLAHPQVWLIPPAVCVLAAAYLNRRQLSEAQMTALRYTSSMAIYLSSTADIFLNGVAQNQWLPIILAALSILGIFAGILLRVRSFLFMGTGFLCLALFTIIWYAAVDLEQTWIWYVCLLLLGVAIFAVFTIFEKKRQQMLEVIDRLKGWEA